MLKSLKEYKNVLRKKEDKLLKIKKYNHVIKITIKSFYDLLYNLLNIKLKTLKKYFNNTLTKE